MLNKSSPADKKEPVVIKKYANRRLYNTETSTYVTLDDLAAMVKGERDFVVFDAKSGDDLTHAVLTQIIVDQEQNEGQSLLPINFLRQLIGFYGDNLSPLVPNYLEHTIQAFAQNQEQMRAHINKSMEGMFPVPNLEEINKQNMAMFENAMRMFRPFGVTGKDDK